MQTNRGIWCFFLNNILPSYTWHVYDGIFDDVLYGKPVRYNHAWIFGTNRKDNRKLFVDLARIHTEQIFKFTQNNRYPKDNQEYKDLKEVCRTQLNWHKMILTEREYYTKLTGKEFVIEVQKRVVRRTNII